MTPLPLRAFVRRPTLQLIQTAHCDVCSEPQVFRLRTHAVAPADLVTERFGSRGVPPVGGNKEDLRGGTFQDLGPKRVDAWGWLVRLYPIHGNGRSEIRLEAVVADSGIQHLRRSVRKYGQG